MRQRIRFLDEPDDGALVALALPGLPPPRFAAVWLGAGDDGIEVEVELRRGPVPEGVPYRMLSVARRDPTLTRAEFAERWRAEAGRLGGEAIPDDVLGLAYAQLHPVADDAPYDAINLVWFDDLDALRRRAEWFAARAVPDLFAESFTLHLEQPATSSGD